MIRLVPAILWVLIACHASAAGLLPASVFPVDDSLRPAIAEEANPEARATLERLVWNTGAFDVTFARSSRAGEVIGTLAFASPKPVGRARQNRVTLDWYAARGPSGEVVAAPAVLVMHSLHPDLLLAKMIARSLAAQGVHAFVMEMPGYGRRVDGPRLNTGVTAMIHAEQGVADARRSRDVIASLDAVIDGKVSIAGMSMGGFFATGAAALDGAFEHVFLFLSGGDCFSVLMHGEKDAKRLRQSMAGAGYDDEKLRALLDPIEPLRLAHRLDAKRTYLFVARGDTVVRPENSDKLAKAVGLGEDHYIKFDGNHYTAMFLMPSVIEKIKMTISAEPAAGDNVAVKDVEPVAEVAP